MSSLSLPYNSASLPRRAALDGWTVAALLICVLVAIPVAVLPALALFPEENIWPHLSDTVLPRYIATTLGLLCAVALGTLISGVASAWLVTMCRFPGRKLFSWALLLPLAMPAYVIAYIYTDFLEFAGPVQQLLRAQFGWESARDYWFPEIRSFGGAATMLTLVLYPYVYLLSRGAFLEQSVAALEVSRTLGCGAWDAFRRVALPSARPAIAVGLSLALMETLNDFGTVDFFGVQTLSAGVYDVWLNMGNLGGAAQIASVMLLFVVLLLVLEQASRRRRQHYSSTARQRELPGMPLAGWRAWGATCMCATLVLCGFVLPAVGLGYYAYTHLEESLEASLTAFAWNSLALSGGAACLTVLVGTMLAYARRLRPTPLVRTSVWIASLGYAVPGAVLAIGVIIPFGTADGWLNSMSVALTGERVGLLLSGTIAAIGFAYMARFLTISVGGVAASLEKVTPSMDMAARTLGHGPWRTFTRVHLPLIRGGMLTAGVIVFVDCMKELPATLILRPFNFDTLATHVYQFASDEQIEVASLGALLIVVAGLLPVLLLSRAISTSRDA